jgi:hypothetical protein
MGLIICLTLRDEGGPVEDRPQGVEVPRKGLAKQHYYMSYTRTCLAGMQGRP